VISIASLLVAIDFLHTSSIGVIL